MNIVNKLTLKYMKKNKSRTLVTIIGVIISVAMIAASSTIGASLMDMLKRSIIVQTGNWQSVWEEVPGSGVEKITGSPEIKKSLVSHTAGIGELPGSKNSQRPYIYILEYNSFDLSAITLKEGRFPKNENELVITTQMLETSGVTYLIGDKVKFTMGGRNIVENNVKIPLDNTYSFTKGEEFTKTGEKEYTITGIVDAKNKENSSRAAYVAFSGISENNIKSEESYTVYAGFNKLNKKIYNKSEKLKEESKAGKLAYNSELLLYAGITDDKEFNTTLTIAIGIVGSIILLGSVSLIYNAFAISLSERSRTLGMLASVGATKRQKRNSVFFEGFVIGCISIPIGLVSGYLGIGITFWLISPIMQNLFNVTVPLKLIISTYGFVGAVLFSILLLFISAWFPAKRASKITPIDAIRQTLDISIKKKNIKTSKLTRIIFGFEAELGLKNLKRNKHRYYATLFSMIISIVLFLTASAFSVFLKESFVMANAPINYDVSASVSGEDSEKIHRYTDELTNLNHINNAVVTESVNGTAVLNESMVSNDIKSRLEPEDGKYSLDVQIISMDDTSLSQYAKEAGIDEAKLKSNGMKGILINTFNLKEKHEYTTVTQLKIKPGDTIPLTYYYDEDKKLEGQIGIAAITDKVPLMLYGNQEYIGNLTILVSKQGLQSYVNQMEQSGMKLYPNINVYYITDKASELEKEIEAVKKNYPDLYSYTFNVITQRQKQERLSLIFSVFLYGFVILIATVCTANIINTISTGINMRKREFAMLKSYGITPAGFQKMIRYESIFYGLKALLYGLPVSFIVIYLVYKALSRNFDFIFFLPWVNILIAIISVFLIIGFTMIYAVRKTSKDNIIDVLKNENL
ncbi:FtsX-like permease family protein [Anaerocolumna sedimenticola]|uniref:FtsX-like permease family protein n=1 Tax=Anaerocolumna sedimenticola TaxID=2696063 RepID=A0A6P1TU75_9FIRM|nr:ABC transporter permease [Anaerocolumna sedimenticola]QHQ63521.1 FtsX-like permease family protein [Anaerocolumna sedimenticola]